MSDIEIKKDTNNKKDTVQSVENNSMTTPKKEQNIFEKLQGDEYHDGVYVKFIDTRSDEDKFCGCCREGCFC